MPNADGLNRRMTSLDASFLYLEQPNALLHVAGIYTFDHPLDYEDLLQYVSDRLPLIPRYTQRAVMVPLNLAHPTWEEDPEFDIRQHIVRHRLKGGHDDAALAALCAKLFAEPLDRSRPLWEMHFIEGYRHGCAVLAKTHHCMIDGASGVQLINLLMDPTPKPTSIVPAPARAAAQADAAESADACRRGVGRYGSHAVHPWAPSRVDADPAVTRAARRAGDRRRPRHHGAHAVVRHATDTVQRVHRQAPRHRVDAVVAQRGEGHQEPPRRHGQRRRAGGDLRRLAPLLA